MRTSGRLMRSAIAGVCLLGLVATVPAEPARAEPLRGFSIAASGDIIPLPAVANRARAQGHGQYDFHPMLADVKLLVEAADLGVCHLEIPVRTLNNPPKNTPKFSGPPEIVEAMKWAGYDRCSTASNHTLDQGLPGIEATLNTFDMAGLGHSGSARTEEESEPQVFEVNGVRISHLAYTYGFNGNRLPAGEEWRANRIDEAKILADATAARQAGAEFVIVSLHWGAEFRKTPTPFQVTLADHLTASGKVDLILGHHTHVLQPIAQVNGKWVVYGMGNLLSNHRPETGYGPTSEDGMVVTFDVTENPGGGFTVARPVVYPTWSQPKTMYVINALNPGVPLTKSALRRMAASRERTRKLVGEYFPA